MIQKIPLPVLNRLSNIFNLLNALENSGCTRVSSSELGRLLGMTSHTIRKDIHYLGVAGTAGAKYAISDLKTLIANKMGFNRTWRCCIVGLGRLGSALLDFCLSIQDACYVVAAAFDSNVNRLETIRARTELFPGHRISDVVRDKHIDIALIAVPSAQAQEVADRCCEGGIRGMLNFSSTIIKPLKNNVFIRTIDVASEMRMLSALMFTRGNKQPEMNSGIHYIEKE